MMLGWKVKGQGNNGHQLQKHVEGDQVAGVSYAHYRVPTLYRYYIIKQ